MTDRKDLEQGKFYWVNVRPNSRPDGEWQPARFTGVSGDSDAAATWDFIGFASANGHHFVEVVEIGGRI